MRFLKSFNNGVLISISMSLLLSIVLPLYFVLSITLIKYAPATPSIFFCFLLSALFCALFFGRQSLDTLALILQNAKGAREKHVDAFMLLLSGISLSMAFYLQLVKRSVYAPSGSDVAFLIILTPLFALFFNRITTNDRLSLEKVAGVCTAIIGAASIVGNWERPSSYALFALFPYEELIILSSAIFMAIFFVTAKRLVAKQYSVIALTSLTLWLATLVMLIAVIVSGNIQTMFNITIDGWSLFTLVGILTILLPTALIFDLLKRTNVGQASSAILFLPTVVTAFISLEKVFGLAVMATPFLWLPVITGSILVLMGVAAIWID